MTKKQPREQRLNDIVSASVVEFLDKGYENTSMDSIAARAGLTKGGLYHHFRSKDEILGYANLRLTEPIEAMVARAAKSTPAVDGVRGYVRNYIRFWAARPRELAFFFLTMTKAFGMPEMRQLYAAYYKRMQSVFADLFTRAIQEGHLRQHDPAARAVTLVGALDGAISYLAFESSARTVSRVVGQLEDVFLNEMRVGSAASLQKGQP